MMADFCGPLLAFPKNLGYSDISQLLRDANADRWSKTQSAVSGR
jgi:hypothetical protein